MENVKGNILPALFQKQKELMEHYIKIEKLPQYPVDLASKSGQAVIKSFVGRFTEELSEGYEVLCEIANMTEQSHDITPKLLQKLKDYNIEIADAFHFLLETMILAGFDERINTMVDNWVSANDTFAGLHSEDEPFGTLMKIAGSINFGSGRGKYSNGIGTFQIVTERQAIIEKLYTGGRRVSRDELYNHGLLLWDVVHYFHRFTNKLNNREWHQEEKQLNTLAIEVAFVEAMLAFAIYLEFALFTQQGLHHIYMHKNQINLHRIQNKY